MHQRGNASFFVFFNVLMSLMMKTVEQKWLSVRFHMNPTKFILELYMKGDT
jgi:hypothetical protein